MEFSDIWKFKKIAKTKCGWCGNTAKKFYWYNDKYICQDCIEDIIETQKFEQFQDEQVQKELDGEGR